MKDAAKSTQPKKTNFTPMIFIAGLAVMTAPIYLASIGLDSLAATIMPYEDILFVLGALIILYSIYYSYCASK
ncbi:TPA: hypothetical protein DEW05_03285 [Candidatus Saccharibacteria bacterium]|nr:hypothetical protein [Candidatus Saccharibacteria bacterium]